MFIYYFALFACLGTIIGVTSANFVKTPTGFLPHYDSQGLCVQPNTCQDAYTIGRHGCLVTQRQNGAPCTTSCYVTPTGGVFQPSYCSNGQCVGKV